VSVVAGTVAIVSFVPSLLPHAVPIAIGFVVLLTMANLTTAILVLAANTSFKAFPRLLAILARDRFVPRQFSNMGDRLVFSNGVIVLAVAASLLIWAFSANLDRLIQLYVVGVFTDFTLSQTGLVKRWWRLRKRGPEAARRWKARATINAVGAVCTATVLAITVVTKFREGAWIDERSMMYLFRRRDLVRLKSGLLRERGIVVTDVPVVRAGGATRGVDGRPLVPPRTVALVLISGVKDATARAVSYARSLQAAETRALYFALEPGGLEEMQEHWFERGFDIRLDLVDAPFRDLTGPLLDEVRRFSSREDTVVAVVMPELLVKHWWQVPLHNQTALFVKRELLFEPRVILSSVPYRWE